MDSKKCVVCYLDIPGKAEICTHCNHWQSTFARILDPKLTLPLIAICISIAAFFRDIQPDPPNPILRAANSVEMAELLFHNGCQFYSSVEECRSEVWRSYGESIYLIEKIPNLAYRNELFERIESVKLSVLKKVQESETSTPQRQ